VGLEPECAFAEEELLVPGVAQGVVAPRQKEQPPRGAGGVVDFPAVVHGDDRVGVAVDDEHVVDAPQLGGEVEIGTQEPGLAHEFGIDPRARGGGAQGGGADGRGIHHQGVDRLPGGDPQADRPPQAAAEEPEAASEAAAAPHRGQRGQEVPATGVQKVGRGERPLAFPAAAVVEAEVGDPHVGAGAGERLLLGGGAVAQQAVGADDEGRGRGCGQVKIASERETVDFEPHGDLHGRLPGKRKGCPRLARRAGVFYAIDPMSRKRHPVLEADITGLAYGGRGIFRLDGLAVFVAQAVPGDRVRLAITRRRKSYAEARLLEVLSPSPDRISPPCRYSGLCGGCTWQFLAYEKQLAYKRQHVAESLARLGGLEGVPVHPAISSPAVFAYRNKMEFTCADRRWLLPEELADPRIERSFALGLHVPGTFDRVLDTEACLLQPEPGNRILAAVRELLRASGRPPYGLRSHEGFWRFAVLRNAVSSGSWMVNLVTAAEDPPLLAAVAERLAGAFPEIVSIVNNVTARRAGIAVGEIEHPLRGEAVLRERLGGFVFEISANSFFQTNTRGAERLYETVRDFAGLEGGETVLDLYSGTGTIPVFLSGRCRRIVGIEIAPSAVADAVRNCRLNGVDNCRFLEGDILAGMAALEERPAVVIADPPRVGMAKEVVRELLRLAPRRIVYVSCNPATLARDLALLREGYEIREVQPVDLFPHTFHIEAVARLEKRS